MEKFTIVSYIEDIEEKCKLYFSVELDSDLFSKNTNRKLLYSRLLSLSSFQTCDLIFLQLKLLNGWFIDAIIYDTNIEYSMTALTRRSGSGL